MADKGQPTMADEIVEMVRCEADYVSEYLVLADHARRLGHWDEALDLCAEALSLCTEPDVATQHCRGVASIYLGAVHHSTGILDEAGHAYFQAEDIFQLRGEPCDHWNEAVAKYGHGLVELSKGDLSKSMRLLRESKNMFISVSKELPEAARQIPRVEARIVQVDDLKRKRSSGDKNSNTVPVIGYTSAGKPISAIPIDPDDATQNSLPLHGRMCGLRSLKEGTDPKPVMLDKNSKYFALVVTGDSMVEVGIHDGEYVIFRQQPSVDSGDIAVIRIDHSDGSASLVKKFIRQGDKIILKAKNDLFVPKEQIFSRSDPTLKVLGKVVAVASQ
jgi:SOS-response transcriptional repressor LexA